MQFSIMVGFRSRLIALLTVRNYKPAEGEADMIRHTQYMLPRAILLHWANETEQQHEMVSIFYSKKCISLTKYIMS